MSITKQEVIALRDREYNDSLELCKGDKEVLEHLAKEYKNCDLDQLTDQINDIVLDSFGS